MEHLNALDILLPKLANSASLAAKEEDENTRMPVTISKDLRIIAHTPFASLAITSAALSSAFLVRLA